MATRRIGAQAAKPPSDKVAADESQEAEIT